MTEKLIDKLADHGDDGELIVHSFRINGRISTLRLEKIFWDKLWEIAKEREEKLNVVLTEIIKELGILDGKSMASSIRVYLMSKTDRKNDLNFDM